MICSCNYLFLIFSIVIFLLFESREGVHVYKHYVPKNCQNNITFKIKVNSIYSKTNTSAIIELSGVYYHYPLSCTFILEPPNKETGITISIQVLHLGNLEKNKVIISDKNQSRTFKKTRSKIRSNLIFTPSRLGIPIQIEFFVEFRPNYYFPHGKILYTAFTKGDCSQFQCANKICISNLLTCNNLNNCNDNSDEVDCGLFRTRTIGYIFISIFILFLLTICFAILVHRLQRRISRQMNLEMLYNKGLRPVTLELHKDVFCKNIPEQPLYVDVGIQTDQWALESRQSSDSIMSISTELRRDFTSSTSEIGESARTPAKQQSDSTSSISTINSQNDYSSPTPAKELNNSTLYSTLLEEQSDSIVPTPAKNHSSFIFCTLPEAHNDSISSTSTKQQSDFISSTSPEQQNDFISSTSSE